MAEGLMLWSTGEVARALELSDETVRALADGGVLPPAARTRRGDRLFSPEAVEQLRLDRAAKKKK
jgi:DNA-binding transcriptional MerR regulator